MAGPPEGRVPATWMAGTSPGHDEGGNGHQCVFQARRTSCLRFQALGVQAVADLSLRRPLASNLLTMPDPYWLMVLPLLLLYVIVYIWPSLIVVATSLTDPVPGLENYRQLITNSSIQRTLL